MLHSAEKYKGTSVHKISVFITSIKWNQLETGFMDTKAIKEIVDKNTKVISQYIFVSADVETVVCVRTTEPLGFNTSIHDWHLRQDCLHFDNHTGRECKLSNINIIPKTTSNSSGCHIAQRRRPNHL